jgi:hypothetical protein
MRYLAAGICLGILLGAFTHANAQANKTITMWDACDPDILSLGLPDRSHTHVDPKLSLDIWS